MRSITLSLFIFWAYILFLTATPVQALYTDDTETQGALKYSVDIYGQFGRSHINATTTNDQLLEADIYAGIFDSVDLVVGIPFYWKQSRDNLHTTYDNGGITDITLDLKWRFLEQGPISFAIKPGLVLPTGDHSQELGMDRPGYGCMFISTANFKPLTIHANLAYLYQNMLESDHPYNRSDSWKLALGAVYDFTDTLRLKSEIVTGTNPSQSSSVWPTFMTAQAEYDLNSHLSVNGGLRWGLNTQTTDIVTIVGITLNFP